ncbi:transcription factor IIIA-like [Syzygium oleosum]|uniref:transcription factor IIIA-like n=1 Tax=Syzygium oleosum TaxID=219896 RepID=UPI0024B9DDDA|nr:transcription factor IIIA-like [Syzygium oleosum]
MGEGERSEKAGGGPVFRDVRRYYCEHCGICRSKKSLIASHIQSHHKEEMEAAMARGVEGKEGAKANTCEECGATFKKPAYLKQHMQGHSLERPFKCSIEDCPASYRRKDHLARHFLQHKGKIFSCPVDGCNKSFAYQGNMKRHMNDIHSDELPSTSGEFKSPKQHVCPEVGCGKVFKFASKLRKHEDSHVKLETVEAFCCECMKYFSNVDYLKEHVQSAHQFVNCDICGTKQLRKNFQRHLRTHEKKNSADSEAFRCDVEGCLRIFSTKSNLRQHVKAVHLEVRPFVCSYKDCGKKFAYKHVRDHHEKTGCHVYAPGDFEESDEQFRSRPRGGRKRKCPTIESLLRKRVTLPKELDFPSD